MNLSELFEVKSTARGRVRVSVIDAASGRVIREEPWQSNLILDAGLDALANNMAFENLAACAAGTGNTPTKDICDGFYYQVGTTVTRESGTRDFISGDVGKLIRFSDGTERKITAYTSATVVTVGTSGAVPLAPGSTAITVASSTVTDFTITAAAHGRIAGDRITITGMTPSGYNGNWTIASVTTNTITVTSAANPGPGTVFGTVALAARPILIYRVNQTGLNAESQRSTTYPTFLWEDGFTSNRDFISANSMTFRKTYDFPERVSNINYTEVGFSATASPGNNLFSRILLAGAVTVLVGQLLRVKYELVMKTTGITTDTILPTDGGITGWPRPYNISSITSNGTAWTVTVGEAHHYVAGSKITIAGALRPKTAITAASSTVSDFTITAAAHGRTAGESITIEGVTPSGYNGTFVIASATTNTITVTSVLNPGAGTVFGTVRQATPATWYDGGEYTVASVTSTTVVITSALTIADAGAYGTVVGNTKRVMKLLLHGWRQTDNQNTTPTGMNYIAGQASGNFVTPGCIEGAVNSTLSAGTVVSRGYICRLEPVGITVPPTIFPALWTGTDAQAFNGASAQSGRSSMASKPSATNSGDVAYSVESAYTNGNFYRDTVLIYGAGAGNRTDIRMITLWSQGVWFFGSTNNNVIGEYPFAYILFEERQRKDSTHKFSLTFRRSWGRDLTIEAS